MLTCCGAEVSCGWAILLIGFLTAALQMHGSLAQGQHCEVTGWVWGCGRSSQSKVYALRCYFTASATASHSSVHCCYSRLSGGERHKWLITCRNLCLGRGRLIVHLHLLSDWKQIKISWPLEAKAMPSESVPSSPCRVENS